MGMITTPLFSPALRSKQGTLIGFKGKRLKELFLLCCHDATYPVTDNAISSMLSISWAMEKGAK
eukprot:1142640-Pelagomonas_calceolata.AAC.6